MIKKWKTYIKESFEEISLNKEEIKKYVETLVDKNINDIFNKVHEKFNTESGDITPDQVFELDKITENLVKLIVTQVHQNLGKDTAKIKTKDLDMEVFESLEDERMHISVGDIVLAMYFNGGWDIFKFKVEKLDDGKLGFSDGQMVSYIDDSDKVITLETYNDFVAPEYRIDDN